MLDRLSCQPSVRFTGQGSRLCRTLLAVQQRQSPTPYVAGRICVRVVRVAAGHALECRLALPRRGVDVPARVAGAAGVLGRHFYDSGRLVREHLLERPPSRCEDHSVQPGLRAHVRDPALGQDLRRCTPGGRAPRRYLSRTSSWSGWTGSRGRQWQWRGDATPGGASCDARSQGVGSYARGAGAFARAGSNRAAGVPSGAGSAVCGPRAVRCRVRGGNAPPHHRKTPPGGRSGRCPSRFRHRPVRGLRPRGRPLPSTDRLRASQRP